MKSAAWFEKFDQQVDNALEHIRDHKLVVIVFSIASAVGDFGLLWHIIGLLALDWQHGQAGPSALLFADDRH